MVLSAEELKGLNDLKAEASKKNCVVSMRNGYFNLLRKGGEKLHFIGKSTNLRGLKILIKKA